MCQIPKFLYLSTCFYQTFSCLQTVSRASRKSRPQSSGSQTDRFQSSESESETDGPRTRMDASSVSDIEFGGVDITDERIWDTDLEMEGEGSVGHV